MTNPIETYQPKFAGEIIVARRLGLNIETTKIDDMTIGINKNLPHFQREEILDHYNKKLQLVWEGKLCFE